MFCVIEFEDKAGGGLAIVHQNWMTPRKHEVFWPPYKSHSSFQRALKRGENAGDDWTLYKVKRTFYQTGEFEFRFRNIPKIDFEWKWKSIKYWVFNSLVWSRFAMIKCDIYIYEYTVNFPGKHTPVKGWHFLANMVSTLLLACASVCKFLLCWL